LELPIGVFPILEPPHIMRVRHVQLTWQTPIIAAMILSHIPTPFSLYHRWRRWQIQQTSALLALPVEILLIVEGFISNVETAAFRTTCRHLYYHKPRLQSMLVGANRAALLKLLEQDNPRLYYCHSCEVLHPLSKIASIRPADNVCHSFGRYGCHSRRVKVNNNSLSYGCTQPLMGSR
jgi:hypothetical protein